MSVGLAAIGLTGARADEKILQTFNTEIQPLLDQYCYDCHGYGADKGGVTLDGFESAAALRDHKLWLRALKNVRAHIMPPVDEAQPSAEEVEKLIQWIKRDAFELDPAKPDPGRVTVRRLNRAEYRNTIRDLTGVDYDTALEFPADDTGHGFDNIGDVLTISTMLMEKYLDAAQAIVTKAVPTRPLVPAEVPVYGKAFQVVTSPESPAETVATVQPTNAPRDPAPAGETKPADKEKPPRLRPSPSVQWNSLDLSYYTPVTVAATHAIKVAGHYQLVLDLRSVEKYVDNQFDYNRCRLIFRADGEVLLDRELVREGEKNYEFTFDRDWAAGDHTLTFEVQPLTPDQPQPRLLRIRVSDVTVRGPLAPEHWVKPPGYTRYFPRDTPADARERRVYAGEVLTAFATKAFRRPVAPATVERLVGIAETVYAEPGNTFEEGIAQAMVAILAAPSFIFREEGSEPLQPGQTHPLVDEYALASRLSYFLWSTMPDEELFRLAGQRQLRTNLAAQVERMLKDRRSQEFVRNFSGQWLQARDIGTVQINAFDIFLREHPNPGIEKARNEFRRLSAIPETQRTPEESTALLAARESFITFVRQPLPNLSDDLREAMRQETELVFDHVIRQDRSLLELIESDYTFLNESLAKHYDIEGVAGKQMRKVTLPPGSPRGGVLTQGTVLAVTSNPTRTSPVKRGVFILETILGTPPAPPPPNIPSLEDAASPEKLLQMSLRETMDLHATNKMCASCHSRMDPLGLALENFNAMGRWRDTELNQPIDTKGRLITGETFTDIRELKHILATAHREDFYHAISEKLLTYALGRGVEYYDTDTLDQLVAQLDASEGRPSALLRGIIESAPFQQRRESAELQALNASTSGDSSSRLTHADR